MVPRSVREGLVLRAVPGLGDRGFRVLVDAFGSAGAALGAGLGALTDRGLTQGLARAVARAWDRGRDVEGLLARLEHLGATTIPYGDPTYPPSLGAIHDPPAVLFVAGDPRVLSLPSVAVVGSRRASTHGVRFAKRLARDLAAAGCAVVSGLARGIDAAAHRGALEGDGPTVAVFGTGLDVVYPAHHRELAGAVRATGAWVTEFDPGVTARAHHFPRRNRIVSGLSRGVVVVEASERSGALITASCALEQGREVFAVPGLPGSYTARGAHALLKQGARLVESVDDVLEEVGFVPRPRGDEVEATPPESLETVWAALDTVPRHVDEISERAGVDAARAAADCMELTLGGLAEEWPGDRYARHPEPRLEGP